MQEVIYYNNQHLLIPGTDKPQVDGQGKPIPDPKFGTTETINHPDPPPPPAKVAALSWEQYRALFTDAELEGLDSWGDGTITLNAAQKRKISTFIEKGKARGSDRLIDVTTAGMGNALDYLEARGFIVAGRKAEIMAGTKKS